jgi:putative transposase
MTSFSQPSVSNNKPFSDLQSAQGWVEGFVDWYNSEHRHSAIKFVKHAKRHKGEDILILADRHQVYLTARSINPIR